MNKYGAKKVRFAGLKFDSQLEYDYYLFLLSRVQSNEITDLNIHTKFPIEINGQAICNVLADFDYIENGKWIAIDVKGADTAISRLKRKLVKACYPSVDWRVVKRIKKQWVES